jgi:hypothetical protein
MDERLRQAIATVSRFEPKFALEEVKCIKENSEEAKPLLLDSLRKMVNEAETSDLAEIIYPHYLLHLLAEFNEHEMLDLAIQILEMDEEICDNLLGDSITNSIHKIISTVATLDDLPKLKSVAENRNLGEFQRLAGLRALTGLYAMGKYPRDEFFSYLGSLLQTGHPDYFQAHISVICYDVHAQEHFGLILHAVDHGKLDLLNFIRKNDFLRNTTPEAELDNIREDYKPVTDTIEEMSWWYCFNEKPSKATPPFSNIKMPSAEEPLSVDAPKFAPAMLPKPPIIIEEGITWKKEPSAKGLKAANAAIKKNEKKQKKAKPKINRDAPCPCGSGKKYKNCCGK